MSDMLQPGQVIRPLLSDEQAKEFVLKLYGLTVTRIKELNSYDDRNFFIQVSPEHTNPNIKTLCPHGFVLKVLNSLDTPKSHVDAEHAVQHILCKNNIVCQQPVLNLEGKDKSKEELTNITNGVRSLHMFRLMNYIPGKEFVEVPYTPKLLYKAGAHLGNFGNTLMNFSHEALYNHKTMWNLISAPKLSEFLYAVNDENRQTLVKDVLCAFETEILSSIDKFKTGVIHGDFNEQNILVEQSPSSKPDSETEYDIVGVLDLGDMTDSYYVFDVAIAVMYMMVESRVVDPLDVGGHVLAGYLTHMQLNDAEFEAMKTCVAARFCQSLVLGAYSYMQDPGNEYLLVTSARGWPILRQLWDTPKEELYARWRKIITSHQIDHNQNVQC